MPKTQIIAEPGVPQLLINREFSAPRDRVFRAYTDPDLLARRLGPRSVTTTIEDLDPRHGGIWRYVSRDAAGNEYGFRGVFHGAPSSDGFIQTFEFEGAPGHVCMETITFEDRDGGTLMRQNSIFQSVADRDAMIEAGMETGVIEGFERLDELLAGE